MLASITPLGERSRRQRFPITVAFLVGGAVMASTAMGAVVALAGRELPLDGRARVEALAAVAAVGLLVDLRVIELPLPTHHRQVDENWLHRYRGWVYGLGFGAQLGLAVATIVTTSAVYAMVAAEALAGRAWAGAAIGAAFGLIRGTSVLTAAGVDSPARLIAFHRRFRASEPTAHATALAAQALVVVGLAATL